MYPTFTDKERLAASLTDGAFWDEARRCDLSQTVDRDELLLVTSEGSLLLCLADGGKLEAEG